MSSLPLHHPKTSSTTAPDGGLVVVIDPQKAHVDALWNLLNRCGLSHLVDWHTCESGNAQHLSIRPEWKARHLPDHDTSRIQACPEYRQCKPALRPYAEILICMMANPHTQTFASIDALNLHLDMRLEIAEAAGKTEMTFDTEAIHRPEQYWTYREDTGFVLKPGVDLVEALTYTTQPEWSGTHYAFSCYRATEYVILLGIAKVLQKKRPHQYIQLMEQWRIQPWQSAQFHDKFLQETGSLEAPYPMRFYTPGDRVWFKNPDLASSDVAGYEGSWVIYTGQGKFTNFWDRRKPFNLLSKCVEVFHWRDAIVNNGTLDALIDESVVAREVTLTLSTPKRLSDINQRMMKYRDPAGVYEFGGCIDASREAPAIQ